MWGWQCDRQTDKQATDRQATSVLATSDLKVKLGFDCLCEDRGTFVGDRRQGDRQQDIIRNGCDFLPKKRSLVLLQEDRYQEDRRQECGQAVRRQSGDRRTDRQAKDRQATSVYFEVLFVGALF